MVDNPAGLKLEEIVQLSLDAIIAVNDQQEIVLFNRAAEQIFEYQVREVLGKSIYLLIPHRFRQEHLEYFRSFAAAPETQRLMAARQQLMGVRKTGAEFPVEASIGKIQHHDQLIFVVFLRDISRRKEIERSMQKWALAFENAEWGIVIGDANATTLELMNPAFARLYGYRVDELKGRPIQDLYAPEDQGKLPGWIQQAHEKGHITYEACHVRKDGSTFQALVDITAVKDVNGAVQYRVVNVQDITERRRSEIALLEREQQYRSVFESTQDGLFINRFDGTLVDFNPAAATIHGYTVEEFRRLQPQDFIHPDSYPIFAQYIASVNAGRQFRGQAVDICKDGSLINVEVVGSMFIYQGEPHTLAVVRDITQVVHAYQLLEQRVEARTRDLSALLEVSRNISSNMELSPLLKLILDQLKTVLDYTGAGIVVIDGTEFVMLEYQGPTPREKMVNMRFPADKSGGYQKVVEQRAPFIIDDIWGSEPWIRKVQDRSKDLMDAYVTYAHSWLGLPLIVKDKLIGVLRVDHQDPGYFSNDHARLALAFAELAAMAIENSRLYQQAQSLAALEERQKLARELHDSVSQALYGIALGVRTARTLVERDPAKAIEPLNYCLNLADASLSEMRALIFELRPQSLEMEGLIAAVRKHAESLKARHKIDVNTELCCEPDVSLRVKEALYRIIQEALQNIIKHARATQVELFMDYSGGQLDLKITDNGQGFNPLAHFPGHMGLKSMRERAELIGGTFNIQSTPGTGTCVQVTVPVDPVTHNSPV